MYKIEKQVKKCQRATGGTSTGSVYHLAQAGFPSRDK